MVENFLLAEPRSSVCMVTGEHTPIASNHPRYIRASNDGAKLISSNDKVNFTFRGRFIGAEEASTVGYETSHKAHNALRWLIARQGYRNGDQTIIAWSVMGKELPGPTAWEPYEKLPPQWVLLEDPFADLPLPKPETQAAHTKEHEHSDVGQAFGTQLASALRGYRANFDKAEGISLLALDAASPGRLSVTFYQEQLAQDYLDNLEKWQTDAAWILPLWQKQEAEPEKKGKAKDSVRFVPYAPLPRTIAEVAYGKRVDENLLKNTVERLLPCIANNAPIPRDLMESCVRRASNRVGLEKGEWNKVLGTACGLYKAYYARLPKQEGRKYSMTLDKERATRDYLYGRLLAAAEFLERGALDSTEEKRPTNAERLFQRFADNPCSTWRSLEMHLAPYKQRLQSRVDKYRVYPKYKRALEEIMDKVSNIEDFTSSRKLEGEFLIGYYCQLFDLKKNKSNNATETATIEGDTNE